MRTKLDSIDIKKATGIDAVDFEHYISNAESRLDEFLSRADWRGLRVEIFQGDNHAIIERGVDQWYLLGVFRFADKRSGYNVAFLNLYEKIENILRHVSQPF